MATRTKTPLPADATSKHAPNAPPPRDFQPLQNTINRSQFFSLTEKPRHGKVKRSQGKNPPRFQGKREVESGSQASLLLRLLTAASSSWISINNSSFTPCKHNQNRPPAPCELTQRH